jgi:hypothetical protein
LLVLKYWRDDVEKKLLNWVEWPLFLLLGQGCYMLQRTICWTDQSWAKPEENKYALYEGDLGCGDLMMISRNDSLFKLGYSTILGAEPTFI